MAIFYPPPQPFFPRPFAVVTQVTPAGAFTDSLADQAEFLALSIWEPPYRAPQRLAPVPNFPSPAAPDLGFLTAPRTGAVLGSWSTPASVTLFTGAAPPQGETSSPPPPLPRNPAFEGFVKSPDVQVRAVRQMRLPIVPPFPDFGYIISMALRAVPSIDTAYRVVADTPLPRRLPQTVPTIGMQPSLVLPSANSSKSVQAQAIQLVWLVPPIKAIRLTPVPNFPPPAPPPPGSFANDRFMIGFAISF